ncbi:MAG TPA: stress response protein [Myxococcota bacterium]|nr:stress response protein [Myxococcota bacterium]
MELKQKGANAQIGSFKQLKVSLIWTSAVDLDLMAFYKTRDGRTGGVYSDGYAGGSLGDLNAFPFIQLSGDEGVGATGGDNQEDLRITKLDDFEEIYICALNFTDASNPAQKVFANYDARVEVITDRGESHMVKLDSQKQGCVAVICKFQSSFMGAQLVNDSMVMGLEEFRSTVPGSADLKVQSKVTLAQKGDSFALKPKVVAGQRGGNELVINLNWNEHPEEKKGFFASLFGGDEEIDLDLGVFFESKVAHPDTHEPIKACVQPLNQGLLQQGQFNDFPWIYHLGDDRTGGVAEGEFVKINLEHRDMLRRVMVFTYIYEGAANWAQTDGVVSVKAPGCPELIVELGKSSDSRTFCAICWIDFLDDGSMKVTKCATFHDDHVAADRTYGWGLKWVAGSKD